VTNYIKKKNGALTLPQVVQVASRRLWRTRGSSAPSARGGSGALGWLPGLRGLDGTPRGPVGWVDALSQLAQPFCH
jgi:hypothetical protein